MNFRLKYLSKFKRRNQILAVFGKYSLNYFLDRTGFKTSNKKDEENLKQNKAVKLRFALEELGPTFVKFGQILSTRPDLLPPVYIKELEKLQDHVLSFDGLLAQKIITEELKQPIDGLFQNFEAKPVAAASLSQVHKAVLKSGEIVAVKIQRPRIKEIIELDLEILEEIAAFTEKYFDNGWIFRPKLMVAEFKKAIMQEINFLNEAANYERFRRNFNNTEYIQFPAVYTNMCTEKVLTMEFIEGTKINEITQEKYEGIFDPEEVAKRGADVILKQILEDGFFHADPHPANLFVRPPATIVMLDVGMTGYLDEHTILAGAKLLQAFIDKDIDQMLHCFVSLGVIIKEYDQNLIRRDLNELVERYYGIALKNLEIADISRDIFEIMVRHDMVLPSNFVLMIKALTMVETTGKQLYPDFDMLNYTKPFVEKLIRKKYEPESILKTGKVMLQDTFELFEHFPDNLNDIIHKLREGKLNFNFEHRGFEKLTNEIDRSSNRLSFSLIVASLFIGSSLILHQQIGPYIFGYPILGVIGYLIGLTFSLGLIISMLRSGK